MIDLIFVIPQDHMLPRLKLIHKNYFLKIDQTRHVVNCPHSRLAARQPNGVISVLAGPLKRRLAGLICIVHTQPVVQPVVVVQLVVQPVVQSVVKCKHRVTYSPTESGRAAASVVYSRAPNQSRKRTRKELKC